MSVPVSPVTVPQATPPESLSWWDRFIGVFYAPVSTFADIARKPDFLFPLIAVVISSVAVTETLLAKIGIERIIRTSLEQSGRASRMSPEQLDRAVSRGAQFGAIIAHVAGVLGPPIVLLLFAAIGLGLLNLVFGAQVNFLTSLAVTCYAYLPGILAGLMGLAMILFGDPEHFNAQTPIPSSVAFFLDPTDVPKPLYSLAASFDIFWLWFLALLGIGFSEASGKKVKALPAFLSFFGIWMIWVLGKMGLAALM